MTHYVLFAFEEGYTADDMEKVFNETCAKLPQELPAVHKIDYYKNIVDREGNMDVMIEIQLEDPAALKTYLEHPLHQEFVRETKAHWTSKVGFDRVDG